MGGGEARREARREVAARVGQQWRAAGAPAAAPHTPGVAHDGLMMAFAAYLHGMRGGGSARQRDGVPAREMAISRGRLASAAFRERTTSPVSVIDPAQASVGRSAPLPLPRGRLRQSVQQSHHVRPIHAWREGGVATKPMSWTCVLVAVACCVPVCLCACVPVCLCACVPLCLCTCVPVCLCACVPVCLCACVLVCLCACVLCACVRTRVRACVGTCVCVRLEADGPGLMDLGCAHVAPTSLGGIQELIEAAL